MLIVIDSVGIGAAPDADEYGDSGSHTLCHTVAETSVQLPSLTRLGLGSIDGVNCLPARSDHPSAVGRLQERASGKDSLTGHWELMGHITENPFPLYPDGFPDELIEEFSRQCGRGVMANRPASGTEIIEELGQRQLRTGDLIVYTSADSVFQVAAHTGVVPVDELYHCCRIARQLLVGEHAVARVIARPFTGRPGSFERTEDRRDFPLEPPARLVLDDLAEAGMRCCGVGKIGEIFSGRGLAEDHHTADNRDGMQTIETLRRQGDCDLVFANLVDFDMRWGHRNNPEGYARALNEFDSWLGGMLQRLEESEYIVITADHGCDPTTESTDHSREYVPLIVHAPGQEPVNLGTVSGFGLVGAWVAGLLGVETGVQRGYEAFEHFWTGE